jgi:hypothetical protein
MLIELMGSMDFLSLEEKTLKGWNHMFYSEDMAVNLAKCSLEPIQMVEYGWIWGTSESNLHMDILKRCLETALHIPKVANEHDKRRVSTSLGFAQKTAYCRTWIQCSPISFAPVQVPLWSFWGNTNSQTCRYIDAQIHGYEAAICTI